MLQGNSKSDKAAIEELEIKNRLLVDKLNNQIYQQASMYKEKTLEVLNRGYTVNGGGGQQRAEDHSTSPLRSSSNGRQQVHHNTAYGIISGQNEPGFARSPLQVNKRPPNVQPSFYVKQELERMENPTDEATGDQQPMYSPLR